MVGKPDLSNDGENRARLKGSAVGTPGLNALDEEREASLADEGGASAAVVESQDLGTLRRLSRDLPIAHLQPAEPESGERWNEGAITALVAAASFSAVALGVLAYRRWAR
jgi:hypothetical protein